MAIGFRLGGRDVADAAHRGVETGFGDPLVLMGNIAMVEDLGEIALQASSARQALTILAEVDEINLVIGDHAMPDVTGVEVAAVVRAERPSLPFILATGHADLPGAADMGAGRLRMPDMLADLARGPLAKPVAVGMFQVT